MSRETYREMMARLTPEQKINYLAKAREREASRRKSGKVAEWRAQPDARELIRKRKERIRRKLGAKPRTEMAAAARAKEANRSELSTKRKEDKRFFDESFIGPPVRRKAMTGAQFYQWRIRTNPDFYCAELDRAQTNKAKTRPGYRDSIVKWADMPAAMKQAKHALYLVAREIEDKHEKHQ